MSDKVNALKEAQGAYVTVPAFKIPMARELNYLVLGAFGSFVHTAKSFAGFVDNRALVASSAWRYVLQPFIGMGSQMGAIQLAQTEISSVHVHS